MLSTAETSLSLGTSTPSHATINGVNASLSLASKAEAAQATVISLNTTRWSTCHASMGNAKFSSDSVSECAVKTSVTSIVGSLSPPLAMALTSS
jgi:hypothetical protein